MVKVTETLLMLHSYVKKEEKFGKCLLGSLRHVTPK